MSAPSYHEAMNAERVTARKSFWRRSFWNYLLCAGVLVYFFFGRIDTPWLSLSGWQIVMLLCASAAGMVMVARRCALRREAVERREAEAAAGR